MFDKKSEANRKRMRENARKNPEANAAKLLAWQLANPERYKETRRARGRRPDVVEKRKEYHRNRYKTDPEYLKRQMEWPKNNPEKRRASAAKWRNKHYRENILFRIRTSIATRLNKMLKRNSFPKTLGTLAVIGCSLEHLRLHIESQFVCGMSWDNYRIDVWHIDHITPCATATTTEEMNRLFHYTNLRPMWALENITKSDFLPDGTRGRHRKAKPLCAVQR